MKEYTSLPLVYAFWILGLYLHCISCTFTAALEQLQYRYRQWIACDMLLLFLGLVAGFLSVGFIVVAFVGSISTSSGIILDQTTEDLQTVKPRLSANCRESNDLLFLTLHPEPENQTCCFMIPTWEHCQGNLHSPNSQSLGVVFAMGCWDIAPKFWLFSTLLSNCGSLVRTRWPKVQQHRHSYLLRSLELSRLFLGSTRHSHKSRR